MPLSNILALRLDVPPLTAQQIADQALIADQHARQLEHSGSPDAAEARREADAIADEFARRN